MTDGTLRFKPDACPECDDPIRGTVDRVWVTAYVDRQPDGTYDWSGESEVWWDTQETDKDEQQRALVVCDSGHEFRVEMEGL